MIDYDDTKATQEASLDYQPGTVVFEKFRVLEKLGSGGMAKVYRATQIDLNREVALKVLHSRMKDPRVAVRFQNEARATSKLTHPHIAGVLDFGVSKQGEPFMAMEMVEGMTLHRLLTLEGNLGVSDTLLIGFQVSSALSHAHKRGIVHRDIKPANIMMATTGSNEEPVVKVLDFGVAKVLKQDEAAAEGFVTDPGALIGSPLYMSPEQSSGIRVTPQSDLYSLGCVLFHCLTGKPPFESEQALDLLLQHKNSPPPEIANVPPSPVHDKVKALVSSLLAKNPSDRPATADDVRAMLMNLDEELAAENETKRRIQEKHDTEETDSKVSAKRRRIAAGTAAGAVIILIVAAAVQVDRLFNEPEERRSKVEEPGATAYGPEIAHMNIPDFLAGTKVAPSGSDTGILFVEPPASDAFLKGLKGKDNTTYISLAGSPVTDEGIKYISKMPLVTADLQGTNVKTLTSLGKITNLLALNLEGTPITDDSLKNLKSLWRLRSINLNNTAISPVGLRHIATLHDLTNLDIQNCPNIKASDMEEIKIQFPLCHINGSRQNYLDELNEIFGRGEHKRASDLAAKVVASLDQYKGTDFLGTIQPLILYARYLRAQNDFAGSLRAIKKAEDIAGKHESIWHKFQAGDMSVEHYVDANDLKKAEALAERQISYREKSGYYDRLRRAEFHEMIARKYLQMNNQPEAIKHLLKCVEFRSDSRNVPEEAAPMTKYRFGPKGIDTLADKVRIGIAYETMRKDAEAKKFFQALSEFPENIKEEYLERASTQVTGYLCLASIYARENDFVEARKQNAIAESICKKHPLMVPQLKSTREQAAFFDRISPKTQ